MASTSQLPLIEDAPRSPRGRRSRERAKGTVQGGKNITTLALSLDERALLCRLADAEGVSLGEVLRRGLRLYAAETSERRGMEVGATG